jgi:3-hydroxyisobutyrate dehydrogenase-like beta-hydroxyacid dehydrogenase
MKPSGNEILLLHPGEMGQAIGRALIAAGQSVSWVSEGRSEATRKRAEDIGLTTVPTLADGIAGADVIVSVCPPDAAEAQAAAVAATGYRGPYVDGNAVAPETVRRIANILLQSGAALTDAGIVGPPPKTEGTTRFYVSGPDAEGVAGLFTGSVVEAIPVGDKIGAASAVKMAYAAWTKGTSALLIAVRALARSEGVEDRLLAEWARSQPALLKRDLSGSIAKAWRFTGEMHEVSKTFADDRLPPGFHAAAAELYQALGPFKDKWDVTLEEALELLAGKQH